MFNPKVIAVSAVVGFILSFLVGVFSKNSFGIIILRAFVSGAGFALVFFVGSFLYSRFLKETTVEPVASPPDVSTSLDEDVLVDDNGPSFYVNNDGIDSDVKESDLKEDEISMNTASVEDVDEIKTSTNAGDSTVTEKPSAKKTSPRDVVTDDFLDELPDLGSFDTSDKEALSENKVETSDAFSVDSDFKPADLNEITNFHDSSVMAQAIRTIMSKDG